MQSTLSVVLPAYNEEGSIASIIERTLAARAAVCTHANLAAVQVIVVSDGSSDRTAEIAGGYPEVTTIAYVKNRGYGAAIMTGFRQATGDLLAFLDADGTCDPLLLGTLCQRLQEQRADIALGSRLGTDSEMPAIRRLGNRVYAELLKLWGAREVTDSASGMRVIRRSALERIYPLPDGMAFTPAMSSIALFDPKLSIIEVPMRYAERTGESKLRVLRDGARFLRIIVDTALSYRPLRFFGTSGLALLAGALALGAYPMAYYMSHRRIEDWMFYRLSAVAVALLSGMHLMLIGLLAQQAVSIIHEDFDAPGRVRLFLERFLRERLQLWGVVSLVAGVALNFRSLVSYFTTGQVFAHWIYVVVGGLLVTFGIECISFSVLARVLNVLTFRKRYALEQSSQPVPRPGA